MNISSHLYLDDVYLTESDRWVINIAAMFLEGYNFDYVCQASH
jgi:hypothetical protein